MFGRLMANQGFNKFLATARSFMGWNALKHTGTRLGRAGQAGMQYGRSGGQSSYFRGQMTGNLQGAGRNLSTWARAGGNRGRQAARLGGAAAAPLGLAAGADFLNPWGLGWGD